MPQTGTTRSDRGETSGQRPLRLSLDLERAGLAELFAREAAVTAGRCRADDARAAFVEAALAGGFALGLVAVRAAA
jgi:hypothetical protein